MKKWQYNQTNSLKNKNNKRQKAFTLIELLVIIAITAILILGINNFSFNTISDKQKLDTKIMQVISQIETIRSNSLLGRGIGTNLDVPQKYEMEFGVTGSGNITTKYLSGSTLEKYNFDKKIKFGTDFESISEIKCLDLSGNENNTFNSNGTGTGKIIFKGPNLTLSGSCIKNSSKILELSISRKQYTKKIQINTLNGLIKIVD